MRVSWIWYTIGILAIHIHKARSVIIRNPSFSVHWTEAFKGTGYGHATELKNGRGLSPVILVPGAGGSRLQAKLDKPDVVQFFCPKKSKGYVDLWLNTDFLLPYALECWADNMRLRYNKVTKRSENAPGVDIRVVGFGNCSSVEYISADLYPYARYFRDVADILVLHQYVRDISLRAAPYDFRLAPDEQNEYFDSLKALVEEMYVANGNIPLTFVAHSLGNLYTLYFLQHQTVQWQKTYIRKFVSLAAPWAGAVRSVKAVTSGDNMNEDIISSFQARIEERSSPSVTFLFPNPAVWPASAPLIITPEKNYTVKDMEELISDIRVPDLWDMYVRTKDLVMLQPPAVPVHCLFGTGRPTPVAFLYDEQGKFPDAEPQLVMGDGDGSVNEVSLDVCGKWQKSHSESVTVDRFPGVEHKDMLADPKILARIVQLVLAND